MPTPITADDFGSGGVICAFVLNPDGPAQPARGAADLVAPPQAAGPVWVHFDLSDNRARRFIAGCEQLPPAARDLLLGDDRRVQLGPCGGGLAAVLGDLDYDFATDPDAMDVVRVYVDPLRIVTARRHPLMAMDRLRQDVRGGLPLPTPARVFAHLLALQADTFADVVRGRAEVIDDAEDRLLKDRGRTDATDLGPTRRLLARLRRHVSAGRTAAAAALRDPPAWLTDADAARLRLVVERLESAGQDLEGVQDRARLIQEEAASRLAQATNRNLYVLSVMTAIFLPITLVTGVFGMNVANLPWLETPGGFWYVVGLMAATIAGTLLGLRWRRML